MHNITILGGNFAGVSTAHYLLRHVLPLLNSTNSDKLEYKVTLISPNDHTFFKVGAPRALSSPEIPLDKTFASIPGAFSNYKTSEFTFIQGEAVQLDEATKSISVHGPGENKNISVQYDSLVIATGTTSTSPLWTLHGDHKDTRSAFEDLHTRLPEAKTILIAGGGAVGVETAGDIAYFYKKTSITLLSGGTRLLPRLKHIGAAAAAESQLSSLSVRTIHNLRVTSSSLLPDGKTSLKLSDGSTKVVDVYIDATGGAPNTTFLPRTWLDSSNRVTTDGTTLRATSAPGGVYSIGDVASFSKGGVPDAVWAVPALGYSIWSDRRKANRHGKEETVAGGAVLKHKKYKQIEADMGAYPIGAEGGVGVIFGWRIPSWLVWLLKSRTFMLDKAGDLATGESVVKA
jgi:NADH dehydrogenase FAD-containing subunit